MKTSVIKWHFIFILSFAMIFNISIYAQQQFQSIIKGSKTPKFSVVASYTIPGKASGLAFDGNFLYCGLYSAPGDDNIIYQIDTSNGSFQQYCIGPHEKAYGLTFDGMNFWTTDHDITSTPAQAIQFDITGNLLDTFDLPTTYMSGIAADNDYFWVAAYYNPDGEIYKVDSAGNILSQFPSPYAQPWDLCVENDNLWIADYYNNSIDKVDTSGNLLESQASLGDRPAGIVFDGLYLWYLAGPLNDSSYLFKVDLGIGPEPIIYFPVDSHDFGDVLLGDSAIWNAKVFNIGFADLIIDNIVFQLPASPVYFSTSLPFTIVPGDSSLIEFIYKPAISGILSETASVFSNTPGAIIPVLSFAGNGTTVGFENIDELQEFSIYPNPFSDNTLISFSINETRHVSVCIYSILGEMVSELKNEFVEAGDVKISWDARSGNGVRLPAGTYFCIIQSGDFSVNKKLILLN
ncbi:MAG: T9SS type A sorting domain-containing protein [Bacteroidales bacterium]|nr:T9SS type A sorting domain-containing protein [Bacteroidales bacterium]